VTRKGDWMQTYTGRQFWPLDPRAEEVCIEDIAHSLSLQCRFAGHCREFYSVAEHSVRVSVLLQEWAPQDRMLHLLGLLHDASEAYLVDLPRPVKRVVVGYSEAEALVQTAIWHRFGLVEGEHNGQTARMHPGVAALIKRADNTLLATEARDLMSKPPAPWEHMPEPVGNRIEPWPSGHAKAMFLSRFAELGGQQ